MVFKTSDSLTRVVGSIPIHLRRTLRRSFGSTRHFLQVPCDSDHVKLASKKNTLMVSASTDDVTNPVEIMVTTKVHLRLTIYADHAG